MGEWLWGWLDSSPRARPDRTNSELGMKWNFLEREMMVSPGAAAGLTTQINHFTFRYISFHHIIVVGPTMVEPIRGDTERECVDHHKGIPDRWVGLVEPGIIAAFCDRRVG